MRKSFRVFVPLLFLDLLVMNLWGALTSSGASGDGRAHIFRIAYFLIGMSNGDYTPIQYHGYSFLAGYGYLVYVVAQAPYFILKLLLHSQLYASIVTWNIIYVLTPLFLSLCVILFAEELRAFSTNEKLLLGCLIIILTPILYVSERGAVPSVWSISFALLALKYGVRDSKIGFLLSAIASIYSETFGYIYVFFVFFLLLFVAHKNMAKTLPFLILATCFSWVQFLEVYRYMSPLLDLGSKLFTFDFGNLFLMFGLLTGILSLCVYYARRQLKSQPLAVVIAFGYISLFIALVSLIRGIYGVNFGMLNTFVDGIIPWRFMYLGCCIPIVIIWLVAGNWTKFKKIITITLILMVIVFDIFVGAVPASKYASYPSSQFLGSLSGQRILVSPPYLNSYNSLVTFSSSYNYSTVTGAYSQGDPTFYYLTVFYEWTKQFVSNEKFSNNIMQLTGSTEIANSSNSSEWLQSNSSLADAVTPISVITSNSTDALLFSLFVNILGQDGYKLVFTYNTHGTSKCIIIDNSSSTGSDCRSRLFLNSTAISYAKGIFSYTPYVSLPYAKYHRISPNELSYANFLSQEILGFFHPIYKPVNVVVGSSSYKIVNYTGQDPILLKTSYYPYFSPYNYSYDVYHFILLPPSARSLTWKLPYYAVSLVVSFFTLLVIAAMIFTRNILIRENKRDTIIERLLN